MVRNSTSHLTGAATDIENELLPPVRSSFQMRKNIAFQKEYPAEQAVVSIDIR